MDDKKIARINELYHKSKSEGLTAEEKAEQQKLRTERQEILVRKWQRKRERRDIN